MRANLSAGTTLLYCLAFFGAAVVHHGTRAANPPWQSLSPVEIEVLRQVSRNEQEIQRAEAKIAELLEQKARTLAELRSGMFCSECKRSASEIERNRGESFSKHLADVKGKPIPASAAVLAEKAAEYDRQIAQLREQVQRLHEGIREAQERGRRDWEARERARREEESRRQQELARQQESERRRQLQEDQARREEQARRQAELAQRQEQARRRQQDEERRRREETAERAEAAMRGFQEQQSALTRSIQSTTQGIQEIFERQRREDERREEMRERQREAALEAERQERRWREEREDREAARAAAEESARLSATAPVADTTAWQAQAEAQARRDEAERQRAQGEARQRAALAEREAERRRAWEAPPAPLAAIGSFRGNSRPPPAVDEDSLLGDVLENSLFSAVGQATSRRFPSPTRSLQDGLFGTLTDRVENRAGDWIRSQPWFRGRSLNDAPAEERDEREFLYSGTKFLLNLLSRNVQGAVNAGRDAVEAGIARPLQRFSEDELFKP